MNGTQVARVLDELALTRGLPKIMRSDNGLEFIAETVLNRAYNNDVQLKQIEPGKNQTRTPISSPSTAVSEMNA